MKIYIPKKNNGYRKKSAALPAAALPFTAADRDRNRTAQSLFTKRLLAIGQSGSAAVPLPRVPPFLCNHTLPFRIYISAAVTLPLQFKRLRLQLEYTKMTHAMMW